MLRKVLGRQAPPPGVGRLEVGLLELAEFIAEVGSGRIGPVERGPDAINVPLVARDGERYLLRMTVTTYLEEPLRCTFVPRADDPSVEAWPQPNPRGPFRSPRFICTPPTAEFYAAHPERRYQSGEGSLVNTVATVFAALHAPEYAGRRRR
jgi:hypothetical protein